MENNNNIQNQIDVLTKRMNAFDSFNSIPLSVDRAWQARGFIKNDFFVIGTGELSVGGNFDLVIPGATKNSIPVVTPFIGGGASPLEAQIIESGTYPGQYQIHVEGTAMSEFYFIVFLFGNQWYARN